MLKSVLSRFPPYKISQLFRLLSLTRSVITPFLSHILFQLVALETVVDSIVLETPGDLTTGIEVRREDLQNLIQVQLKQTTSAPITSPSQLPPDIA